MDYNNVDDVRAAIEGELGKLTRCEWRVALVILGIKATTHYIHLTEGDLNYDIPRIKELISLMKREQP